jgi:hypothetical protein
MSAERDYYDVLKHIATYTPPEKLKRDAHKSYGLEPSEAVEMAYENVLMAAKETIRGKRRPKA